MTRILLSIIILLISAAGTLQAQILRGVIQNKKGEPVPNSSVYIKEVSQGLVADDNGHFQTNLKAGSYTCEFRSMGYESQTQTVVVEEQGRELIVVLEEKIFGLDEVIVYADDEDPAYRIMRRAIAYAPFYKAQVNSYRSRTYTKGSLQIDRLPGILRREMKINGENVNLSSLVGQTFVMESDNEIEFTAPNNYNQHVLAAKSSIPPAFDMGEEALKVTTTSIYDENFLSPGAFRYYRFKLVDVDYGDGRVVNKIIVMPRNSSGELYRGFLYILQDTWNVYAADLTQTEMGSTMRYKTTFHEVKPSVYLPTTYDVAITLNTMGVKGSGRYFVSVTYDRVDVKSDNVMDVAETLIPAYDEDEEPVNEKQAKRMAKDKAQIEELLQKDRLSNAEAYRLAKLMQSASETEEEREAKSSLEIKRLENIQINVDTLALVADSTYWSKVRKLPLLYEEARSYAIADSINPPDSTRRLKKGVREVLVEAGDGPESLHGKLLLGGGFDLGKKSHLNFSGLANAISGYNFVDGFSLGQSFRYRLRLDSTRYVNVTPSVHYVTARKAMRWDVSAILHFAPMHQGYLTLSAGHNAVDLNERYGFNKFLNTSSSLLYGKGYIRYYDKKYVSASMQIDLANGLNLGTSLGFEARNPLHNLTTFHIFGKGTPEPNMPDDWSLRGHNAALLDIGLTYTPRNRYRIMRGTKIYDSSVYPTFQLNYKKAIVPPQRPVSSKYDMVSGGISQTIKTSLFSSFDYSANAGKFFNVGASYMPDYKFFAENPVTATSHRFNNSFSLLPRYTFSNRYWVQAHTTYTSQYLLLNNLQFMQGALFDEAVHLHYLHTDGRFNHVEAGYSMGFEGLMRMGVFAGFDGRNVSRVEFRISMPLLSIYGFRQ